MPVRNERHRLYEGKPTAVRFNRAECDLARRRPTKFLEKIKQPALALTVRHRTWMD